MCLHFEVSKFLYSQILFSFFFHTRIFCALAKVFEVFNTPFASGLFLNKCSRCRCKAKNNTRLFRRLNVWRHSGVYEVNVTGVQTPVDCDMMTADGGWLVGISLSLLLTGTQLEL
jgi:hypothetical protein